MKLSKLGRVLSDEEAGKRLMPKLSTLDEAAEPAVQWCIETYPDAWGRVQTGRETWAVLRLRDALNRVVGRVALAFVDWVDSLGPGAVDTADGWDAASVRRASCAAVMEEAGRIAPRSEEWAKSLKGIAEVAGEDADLWQPEDEQPSWGVRILALACAAQWLDSESKRPALTRVVTASMIHVPMRAQLNLFDETLVEDAKKRPVGRIDVSTVPGIDARTALALVHRGIGVLGEVPGQRLIDRVLIRAHHAKEAGEADFRRVAWRGGLEAVAADIMPGQKDWAKLRALFAAGSAVQWVAGDGGWAGGGLWTYTERRGGNGRGAGEVALVLGDALLKGFVHTIKGNSLTARESRQLVPILEHEPPMKAVRANEAGAVWQLSRLFVFRSVVHAPELVTEGGILLTPEDWQRLAEEAGLPRKVVPKVLDSWLEDESARAPALLKRDGDRWTLADAHEAARVFIENGGRERIEGGKNGRKGSASKKLAAVQKRWAAKTSKKGG